MGVVGVTSAAPYYFLHIFISTMICVSGKQSPTRAAEGIL